MILYFSGCGNSRYAAYESSASLGEEVKFIPHEDPSTLRFAGETLGIVCPVYSWGIPPIVLDFISRLNEEFITAASGRGAWGLLTCGDDTGKAPRMLQAALARRGITLKGCWSVEMPNTYVLLPGFDTDKPEAAAKKLDHAPDRIHKIAAKIKQGKWEEDYVAGSMPGVKTGVVYPLFRRFGINPKKWRWTQECVKCGKCAQACPVGNITLQSGHPKWGNNCLSCLACYHSCPTHAVEYGHRTTNKGQYLCHKLQNFGQK